MIKFDGVNYRIKHAWAIDNDYDSCQTYKKNIYNGTQCSVINADIKDISFDNLGNIDCLAFGFPCNDFSIVGEKKGLNGNYGSLYLHGVRALNHFKPIFFVAENVGGLTSSNDGKTFKKILGDLENAGAGYSLTSHLFKAEEYGVPQRRNRVFIVGIKKSLKKFFKVPNPTTKENPLTCKEALENPPISESAFNNELTNQSKRVVERLKRIKPGQNAWNSNLPDHLKLNVPKTRLSHIYRRLSPDQPSYTITGSGGGGTHCYHWEENRALTNRERARLQSFPDEFVFMGSKESVRKQIGMAVPPKLSQVIFSAILKLLAGCEYKSINANIQLKKDIDQRIPF